MSHNREIAGLWARSLTFNEAVGGKAEACAYCEVALAGARCLSRRVSTGLGAANVIDEAFCEGCRGRYDQRGPKHASQWAGSAGKRPTHRNTLAPYQDDEEGEGGRPERRDAPVKLGGGGTGMTKTTVADLSPGTLLARSTGWRYRVQASDRDADRVVLCGPRGSLAVGYGELQCDIASGRVGIEG